MRTLKATFGAAEKIETSVLPLGIAEAVLRARKGEVKTTEMVGVFWVGLAAANDTRFTYEKLGDEMLKRGMSFYLVDYLNYLAYFLTGGQEQKINPFQNPSQEKKDSL